MTVFRINKNENYTVMSNYHLREKEMSLKAKGLLSMMLSLRDDWDYSIAGLVSICKENETAVKSALKELQRFGYLAIVKKMPNETDSGRIEYIYDIFEQPKQKAEKQGLENLPLENQPVENHGQLSTKESSTKESNTKKEKRKRFTAPSLEEVRAYCLERNNSVDPQRFIDYYESKGWVVGKSKMKDWKAAVRTWENNGYSSPKPKTEAANAYLEANKDNGWGSWDWND